ncbi:DUF4369 domain-containing protein [Siansivirga zeaxanthinifaciens]|uniref:DUF4369 domain-containing protein n=1 Tax=Siansivirga zeaxanthinifaciens CC-SAMT-1 TaxID=1454006 RepID=A0A0C5WAQ5_9FLAO|nr:DUF4369 domain-containing protein [Siansivirga zeaxanthinifaciens]AJR03402.1 hypothetical protein AW14_06950 [Siansivirga zeaxanthinifaciens CC-SAMT-1]
MKNIFYLFLLFSIISCSKKESDLIVKANVKGLKKGTIYLKKIEDTMLVTVDSMVISGNSEIELYSDIESPEVFYLYLDKNSAIKDRITFFADKGVTEITTSVKNFAGDAIIKGSTQQETFSDYQKMITRFNQQNLDLIKETFEAKKAGDSIKVDSIQKMYEKNIKRKYLFTVNFALNNKNSEVAPYLALSEIYNAKINYLDTINNSLSEKVKSSKYGKELQKFIDNIKATEN